MSWLRDLVQEYGTPLEVIKNKEIDEETGFVSGWRMKIINKLCWVDDDKKKAKKDFKILQDNGRDPYKDYPKSIYSPNHDYYLVQYFSDEKQDYEKKISFLDIDRFPSGNEYSQKSGWDLFKEPAQKKCIAKVIDGKIDVGKEFNGKKFRVTIVEYKDSEP